MTRLRRLLIFITRITPVLIFCNGVSLFLILLIILYTQRFEPLVQGLLIPPATLPSLTGGLLTHIFKILCSVPRLTCGFSFLILELFRINSLRNYSDFTFVNYFSCFDRYCPYKLPIQSLLLEG